MNPRHCGISASIALAVYSLGACVQTIQNPEPSELTAEIIASARDAAPGRNVVVHLASLTKVPNAFHQDATPDALRAALGSVSTDTTHLAPVCPRRAPCHYPENVLGVRIDDVETSTGRRVIVHVTLTYNRTVRATDSETLVPFLASSQLRITYQKTPSGWKELSRVVTRQF